MKFFEFHSKTKIAGFVVTVVAAALALVTAFVYLGGYEGSVYMSWWVVVLLLVSAIATGALIAFRQTAPYSALVVAVLNFTALLVFIRKTYLYLSEVFYAGISAEAFANIDPSFAFSVVVLPIAAILGNVGIYLLSAKEEAKEEAKQDVKEEQK